MQTTRYSLPTLYENTAVDVSMNIGNRKRKQPLIQICWIKPRRNSVYCLSGKFIAICSYWCFRSFARFYEPHHHEGTIINIYIYRGCYLLLVDRYIVCSSSVLCCSSCSYSKHVTHGTLLLAMMDNITFVFGPKTIIILYYCD